MSVTITTFRDDIKWIDVSLPCGIKARLCNYGASVYSLSLDNSPLILSLKDEEEFLNCPQYYGKTLGRVAGRIPGIVNIEGKDYTLKNAKSYSYALHGGDDTSLSFKTWDVKTKESFGKTIVSFSIVDPDMENGFPGKATIKVNYIFYNKKAKLRIEFNGKANKDTLMNLSNHMYWNFNHDKDISEYKLKMNCSHYGDVDETVFIKETKSVPNELDFRRATKLGKNLEILEKNSFLKTIDNTFLFDKVQTRKPQVILKSKDINLKLYTSFPAMNIYVDNSMTPVKFVNKEDLMKRRGIALEPQLYNHEFDSLRLKKGDKFNHFILYKFKKN